MLRIGLGPRARERSGRVWCGRLVVAALLVGMAVAAGRPPRAAHAATVPAGFRDFVVGSASLSSPTAFDIAPDGRIFVTEQGGSVRVIKGGAVLPTPFLTIVVGAGSE